jgi:hypothetical protein
MNRQQILSRLANATTSFTPTGCGRFGIVINRISRLRLGRQLQATRGSGDRSPKSLLSWPTHPAWNGLRPVSRSHAGDTS